MLVSNLYHKERLCLSIQYLYISFDGSRDFAKADTDGVSMLIWGGSLIIYFFIESV